jgi:hypothetical protein
MPCENYREALIEAAAVDARLSPKLRSHLDACTSCRAAFVEEMQLFAAIDTGLRTAANAEVPPSFFPGVRASLLDDSASGRGWRPFLIFAAAAVAMVLTVFITARPRHTIKDNQAKQIFSASPREKAEASARGEATGTPAIVASSRSYRVPHQRNAAPANSASLNVMDVLVPPEEREAFARFISSQSGRSGVVIAVVAAAPDDKDKRLSLEPLEIAELQVRPLEALASELPDGTDEEQ